MADATGPLSLAECIGWVHEHLDDEEPPVKLHTFRTDQQGDLGSPEMTAQFIAWLSREPFDTRRVPETRLCNHPRQAGASDCPDCGGEGVYTAVALRFVRPMRAALERLRLRAPRDWPERQPAPYPILRMLFICGLDIRRAALQANMGEGTFEALSLMALRRLRGRYRSAPYRVDGRKRKHKSEAQLDAEYLGNRG